jgi:murein DD-endopeptidase MepM/ murein hydrolase activator NlpD
MKNAGKIFLTLTASAMLLAPSFLIEGNVENTTVIYVPISYDKIFDHRINLDTVALTVEVSIPNGYPVDEEFLKKSIYNSSGFGYRIHPVFKTKKLHTGLDMSAKKGTPIKTTADGQVIRIQHRKKGYGWNVVIQHTDHTYRTLYAHMSRIDVEIGQNVKSGEVIGAVGTTGTSTGDHLHYEVMKMKVGSRGQGVYKKVNPVPFIEGNPS